jgi:hypothetical protein
MSHQIYQQNGTGAENYQNRKHQLKNVTLSPMVASIFNSAREKTRIIMLNEWNDEKKQEIAEDKEQLVFVVVNSKGEIVWQSNKSDTPAHIHRSSCFVRK